MDHLLALRGYFVYAAIFGGLVMFCCRRSIRHDAIATSDYWTKAFRIIPFAEMFFAASHWDQRKMRAAATFWSVGFLCCIPFALEKLEKMERAGAVESGGANPLAGGGSAALDRMNSAAMKPIEFLQRKARLEKLNQLLIPWYEAMRMQRAALTGATPGTVEAFNTEAAAYKELLQFTVCETQAIAAWESTTGAEEAVNKDDLEEVLRGR